MILREYQPSDRAACLAVMRSNVPPYFGEDELPEFETFLDASPCPYYVLDAVAEGVIGMGGQFLRKEPRSGGIAYGLITRSWHGQGFGEFLLLFRLERLLRMGPVDQVLVNTSQHTEGFFTRMGFETAATRKDYYAAGIDRVEMVLPLDAASCDLIRHRLMVHPRMQGLTIQVPGGLTPEPLSVRED